MYLVRVTCRDCGRDSKFENTVPKYARECLLCREDPMAKYLGPVGYGRRTNKRNGKTVVKPVDKVNRRDIAILGGDISL